MVQNQLSLDIVLLGIIISPVFTSSCQKYPSEYAYSDDLVSGAEKTSANCRRYPSGLEKGLFTEEYVHCNGTQLILTDSDLGPGQYQSRGYYVIARKVGPLLFTLPTTVSLTTITLHYYSDSDRGLPELTFYAVPDNFDVWDILGAGSTNVGVAAVPPGGEPAGRRNVSINVNFNTKKVLMHKDRSTFQFAVSEVEFFTCMTTTSTAPDLIMTVSVSSTKENNYTTIFESSDNSNTTQELEMVKFNTTKSSQNDTKSGYSQPTTIIAVGIAGILLILLIISFIIALLLLLCHRKRRTRKLKIASTSKEEDASYSTLDRGTKQMTRPQDPTELYDQIHLSPSTGQTELISKTENESAKDTFNSPLPDIYSSADMENSAKIQDSEMEKNISQDPTYAIVDKKKKKKKSRETSKSQTKSPNSNQNNPVDEEKFDATEKDKDQVKMQGEQSLEDMYAVVNKKPKKCEEQEEAAPPIPSYTVESLYTAVQKNQQ